MAFRDQGSHLRDIRALDLFCGLGGSSAGARAAGVTIAGGVDSWHLATATFASNFPDATVLTTRLEDLDGTEAKRAIGDVDIILASPECTNHTCAKGAAPRSEASRATAMQAVRFAELFRPRWIIIENVVHMRPWPKYSTLCADLARLGYHLEEHVLDSSDFRVPQTRRRLFLIGDRQRRPHPIATTRRGPRRSCGSILDRKGRWPISPLFGNGRALATINRAKRARRALGTEVGFLLVYYSSDGSGGWQELCRPLRTVTTVDRFALVEPSDRGPTMRMLQVPELRRAMGLPSEHVLADATRREHVRLLGNAVCPPVMEQVVKALIRTT